MFVSLLPFFLTFLVQSLIYIQCCHFLHVCLLPVNSGILLNSPQYVFSFLNTFTNKSFPLFVHNYAFSV